jgi:hypothetical protein
MVDFVDVVITDVVITVDIFYSDKILVISDEFLLGAF